LKDGLSHAVIGGTLDEAGCRLSIHNRDTPSRASTNGSASVKIRLTVRNASWRDNAASKLESKIAEITAGLIVKGERIAAGRYRQERLAKAIPIAMPR
jgi:hypothetical protein